MKTILYATDLSENSVAALKYSYALCKKTNAFLSVIHVFEMPAFLTSKSIEQSLIREKDNLNQHQKKLEEFCVKHLDENLNNKNIEIEAIENSSVLDGIISKSIELKAFVIVVGVKGKSPFKEFLLGTTSEKLIQRAPCALLTVPENTTNCEIKTIVYATDFERADISSISRLIRIAKPFSAKIKIVHISPKNEYDGRQQLEWFKEILFEEVMYEHIDFELFYSNDIFNILKAYHEEIDADLIAMLERRKKGIFKNLFHQDLVLKMETYATIPLLSFNEINY